MEALVQLLLTIFDRLKLWAIVQPNEGGVRIRTVPAWFLPRGPFFKRLFPDVQTASQWVWELGPGAHHKVPLIDRVFTIITKRRTVDVPNIRVETKSGTYLLSLTLTYQVHNVRKALLEVEHFDTSLAVDAERIIVEWANATDLPITAQNLQEGTARAIRTQGFKWGCTIEEVGVNNIAKHRVLSLMMTNE